MNQHKKASVKFLVMGFAVVILAISASTSFGFFFTYFPDILPDSLTGGLVAAILAGVMGVSLLDLASVKWLLTYLHDAETPEQRAVALILSVGTFIGAAGASVAHLSLNAYRATVLTANAQSNIQLTALVIVIVAVVANFAGVQAYQRFSIENKERVRESDRLDAISKAEDEQARLLDSLIAQDVKTMLTEKAPELAKLQAERITAEFMRRERAKYNLAELDPKEPVASPNGHRE